MADDGKNDLIEHRLDIDLTVTVHDGSGSIMSETSRDLDARQVNAFRKLCDECFAETHCSDGAGCAMYRDRVFRGGDAS